MLTTLAFRHLWVRKLRSLVLLLGFSLGVGVMIVLLSVGEAMLDQSRDVSLVGGGAVTVLPQGIDVEAMRTGGISGMFFGIDRARFVTRQVLGGPRHADLVTTAAPAIEGELLYLCADRPACRPVAVRAGGEIPSRARALGTGLDLRTGRWEDSPADSAYVAPTPQQLYDELDRFHIPQRPDSTWAEWHYFNLVTSPEEWWYISYIVGGEVPTGRWGGRLLVTHRRPDGGHERFTEDVPAERVTFDTARADLAIGKSFVHQRNGAYFLRGRADRDAGRLLINVAVRPVPNRYFPPVELREEEFRSGYVVPALVASASGTICVGQRCTRFMDAPAYHDHNWGVWRDVTWEWGTARGRELALLYGGVYGQERAASPFFLTLTDSLGVQQVLRFDRIDYRGSRPASGEPGVSAPEAFTLLARREADTLRLEARIVDALASRVALSGHRRYFLQMRGRFTVAGRIASREVADSGMGFFETYISTHP